MTKPLSHPQKKVPQMPGPPLLCFASLQNKLTKACNNRQKTTSMAPASTARRGKPPKAPHVQQKTLKRKRDEEDIAALEQRIADLDPAASLEKFTDLPLSAPTLSGLSASHFKKLTEIQSRAIPHALKGKDILGAAKTGSGKTLSFLLPVLENLHRARWTEYDGLGALIISPTRELAIQIFEVLRKIGRYHTFSAGLVIGGKSLSEERERLGRMNILVCTPGRMLQHMDQTAEFEIDNLKMLILDEADRIMDMGFKDTVDAIVEHLPKDRQTMLFSATQTRKVSDLARLSLREPEYVSVHEAAESATPATLQQHYIVTTLPEKLDTLWSFMRTNLKAKTIVFLASGKQVRYVYEAFRHMQPGIPLLHLHGRQKQGARLDITKKFSSAKYSCLFATDVAARGLDFPAVDWVIQLDCPEDADTYIHRVGRTARYERDGRAVLFLEPTEEEGMLERLAQKKVPIEKIGIKAKKQQSVKSQLQNMCFKDPELKYLGQKAFVSYVRSVHVQKDKSIFKVQELPLEEFASSLGLPGAPRIKFIKGDDTKTRKNAPRGLEGLSSDEEEVEEGDTGKKNGKKEEKVRTKYDRMFERRNQDILTDHYTKMIGHDEETNGQDQTADADEDDDFLSVKRRFDAGDETLGVASGSDSEEEVSSSKPEGQKTVMLDGKNPLVIDSKRREKLLESKKKLLRFKDRGSKLVYDEDGNAHEVYELEDEEQFRAKGAPSEQRAKFLEEEAERTRQADIRDKEVAKQKKQAKKEKRKARERAEAADLSEGDDDGEEGVAYLAPAKGAENVGVDLDALDWSQERSDESAGEEASKPKKWFQRDSDDERDSRGQKRQKRGRADAGDEPQTLEDLEALAANLLG